MIRCKASVSIDSEGFIKLRLTWVRVKDEQITAELAVEEFRISPERAAGSAYVSRAEFEDGLMRPSTFWVDENGHRHFRVEANVGVIGLVGAPIG